MSHATELAAECRNLQDDTNDPLGLLLRRCAHELDRLDMLLNHPTTANFLEAVRAETPHQALRWGSEHDAGKTPVDWLFLVSMLASKAAAAATGAELPEKALHAAALDAWDDARQIAEDEQEPGDASLSALCGQLPTDFVVRLRSRLSESLIDKAKHHTITVAAACANWHAALCGQPLIPTESMRPGIAGPVVNVCSAHGLPCDDNGDCQVCRGCLCPEDGRLAAGCPLHDPAPAALAEIKAAGVPKTVEDYPTAMRLADQGGE